MCGQVFLFFRLQKYGQHGVMFGQEVLVLLLFNVDTDVLRALVVRLYAGNGNTLLLPAAVAEAALPWLGKFGLAVAASAEMKGSGGIVQLQGMLCRQSAGQKFQLPFTATVFYGFG